MRYIHFRDDFSIQEQFYTDDGNGGKVAIDVPERVEIEFFTSSGRGRFVARRNGNQYENCSLSQDGKTLTVFVSLRNRPIGFGRLLRLVTQITNDASFPEGLRYSRFPGQEDAVLYLGKTDGPLDLTSEVIFGMSSVTLDEVWQSLSNHPAVPGHENTKIALAHIPDLPWSKIVSGKPVTLAGYGISDAYTKEEVNSLIGSVNQFHYEIYVSLEDVVDPESNVLYLIGPTGSGSDKYEEYVYANEEFTKIGDTTIDLSPYLLASVAEETYATIASLGDVSDRVEVLEARQNWDEILGIDQNGNVYLKDYEEGGTTKHRGLWTPSFVTAGGPGSSGGGGGGGDVNLLDVWASLQNNDEDTTYNDWKIATAHLPTLSAGTGLTASYSSGSGSGASYTASLSIGIASGYKLPTIEEWNSIGSGSESTSIAIQSLQSQIDSVSARDMFDELTASSLFADMATISNLYVQSVELDGDDLATTLSSLSTAISDEEAAREDADDILSDSISDVSDRVEVLEARQNWDEILGIDQNGNVYLKDYEEGGTTKHRGLWTPSFVTAGGPGSSGGGGGGGDVNLLDVWASLQNNDEDTTYNDWKIATAHLPTLSAGTGLTASYSSGSGSGASYTASLSIGIASGYKLPTTNEWNEVQTGLSTVSGLLQSIQSQIDSVSGLEMFDELTASSLFADMGAISSLYVQSVDLDGADLATTLAGKQATINDLSTIRSRSDEGHTAYGWGNHANAGYFAAASFTAANIVSTLGNTSVNRAAADSTGENIATNMGYIGAALHGLQAQIDSVASRSVFDELMVANLGADIIVATNAYFETIKGELNGNAATASLAQVANLDSASENIATNMTYIGTAIRALQSQVDSISARLGTGDEMSAACGYFDTLSVGAGIYAGSVYAIGYITAGASASASDARLKDNIKTISPEKAIELLMKLRGAEWDWNDRMPALEGKHGSGLVAQEVREVMPWIVNDLDGRLTISHDDLWGMAVPAMQDFETRLETVEQENKEFKKLIKQLLHGRNSN